MLSPSIKNNPQIDRWIKFNNNKTVTIYTGKVEIGQKLSSAFSIIAAEELSLDFDRIILFILSLKITSPVKISSKLTIFPFIDINFISLINNFNFFLFFFY